MAINIAISRNTTKLELSTPQGSEVQTSAAAHSKAANGLAIGVKNPIRRNMPVNARRLAVAKALTVKLECEERSTIP